MTLVTLAIIPHTLSIVNFTFLANFALLTDDIV